MRKTVFVCDRCGAEIDGLPAMVEVQTIRETIFPPPTMPCSHV